MLLVPGMTGWSTISEHGPQKIKLVNLWSPLMTHHRTSPVGDSLHQTLKRVLWLALATSTTVGCGAAVEPGGDASVDGRVPDPPGCRHFDGTIIPVGQSRGEGCNACFCPAAGLAPQCAQCPRRTCQLPNGRTINQGESAMVECNTCSCDNNGQLVCTALACVDAGVPDAGPCTPRVSIIVGGCEARVEYPCGAPGGPIDAMLDRTRCNSLCQVATQSNPNIFAGVCNYQSFTNGGPGSPNVIFCGGCGVGRLTDEIDASPIACTDGSMGQWLAQSAWFEGVAADAFDRLANELLLLQAPADLIDRSRQNGIDEQEHHRVMCLLAEREGVTPASVQSGSHTMRSLAEIAIENAGEGCVRETLGALVMQWQGLHAETAELREVFSKIAQEETAHAQWSWELDAWARSVLSVEQIAQMDARRTQTVAALTHEMCDSEPFTGLRDRAGMPSAFVVRSMIAELQQSVWA